MTVILVFQDDPRSIASMILEISRCLETFIASQCWILARSCARCWRIVMERIILHLLADGVG